MFKAFYNLNANSTSFSSNAPFLLFQIVSFYKLILHLTSSLTYQEASYFLSSLPLDVLFADSRELNHFSLSNVALTLFLLKFLYMKWSSVSYLCVEPFQSAFYSYFYFRSCCKCWGTFAWRCSYDYYVYFSFNGIFCYSSLKRDHIFLIQPNQG